MNVKPSPGGWVTDFWPEGRDGPRIRKTFPKKRDAEQFIITEKAKAQKGTYLAPVKDSRRLSDLVNEWHSLHGHTLNSGNDRKKKLLTICNSLGDPLARNFEAKDFLTYQEKRLSAGISKNNMRHELAYLKAVFNILISVNDWNQENPLRKIKPLKLAKRHPFFLQLDQIEQLLSALTFARNKDVLIITKICLSTGCRWGEAQYLHAEDVHNGKIFIQETKNSLARSVPIEQKLINEIFKGRPVAGQLFTSAWEAFNFGLDRAKIKTPKGTKTHVLRHSFASHFMMNGGDLLQLNKILGHQTIQMTMVYAHLAPKYLESAKQYNPVKALDKKQKTKIT